MNEPVDRQTLSFDLVTKISTNHLKETAHFLASWEGFYYNETCSHLHA